MLYTIILSVIVIICVLLTIVILLQPGQGQGLSGGLAGGGGMQGGGGQGLGARRTADLLSKSTTVLGTALLVLCVLANFAINRGGATESAVQQSGVEQTQNGMNDASQTPSAVPELPANQGNNAGGNSGGNGGDGGSGSDGGN